MKIKIVSAILLVLSGIFTTQAQTPKEPDMIHVNGGTFRMGSINSLALPGEDPVHTVTVSNFYISKYEVTVGEYKAFCAATNRKMPKAPKWGWKDNDPMVNVSFHDAIDYCAWLSKIQGTTFRLPTEAEWEYAAKGGEKSEGYRYAGSNSVDQVSWNFDTSEKRPASVGKKKPNELGLYDMSGNVWEWCNDFADRHYYFESPRQDPTGPKQATGSNVLRGGSWFHSDIYCRVTHRWSQNPRVRAKYIGFRVAAAAAKSEKGKSHSEIQQNSLQ